MVAYIDSVSEIGRYGLITVRVRLLGVWDGEKVQFGDKPKTLVRNKHWLKKIKI